MVRRGTEFHNVCNGPGFNVIVQPTNSQRLKE